MLQLGPQGSQGPWGLNWDPKGYQGGYVDVIFYDFRVCWGCFGICSRCLASFIKESLMRTHSVVFPSHETNEKQPYISCPIDSITAVIPCELQQCDKTCETMQAFVHESFDVSLDKSSPLAAQRTWIGCCGLRRDRLCMLV